MAFSFESGNGGRRGRFRSSGALSEINIVPLVDVVLVLLIIFMLTAHVMEFGMDVNVPQVREVKDSAEELPVVNITRNGELFLNDKPVNINEVASQIHQRFRNAKAVYVRADKSTIWDPIAQVIDMLAHSGLDVKMVAKPEESVSGSRGR